MTTTTIPYSKLLLSDTNVRKSDATTGLAALAASIAEHGLIQPLIVSPATARKIKYVVHAGGRRWRAIGMLVDAGKLPVTHPVEVKLVENETAAAREISLAENLLREPMSPAEECSAYREIIADGADVEDVARRFGVTVRHVQGRLRLADLADPIFAALAAGDITLDVAMAYGSTSDHARQLAAWERCSVGWQSDNVQAIRRVMAEDSMAANNPIALFVGEAEYVGAGGRIERDLFAAEGEGTWLDSALAHELATKKLTFESEVAALGTKLGWVKPILATHVPYDVTKDLAGYYPRREEVSEEARARMTEIEAKLDDLSEQLEQVDDEEAADALYAEQQTLSAEYDRLTDTPEVIPEEDRPSVGAFLFLSKEGEARLSTQYYTTATARSRSNTPDQNGGTNGHAGADHDDEVAGPTDALPRSLEEQLAKDRRDILALHVAHDAALALDLVIFNLARNLAGHFGHCDTGCSIHITDRYEPAGLKDIPASTAMEQIEQLRTSLPTDWATGTDSFTSFLAFRALDDEARASWLSYAVSQSLQASLATGDRRSAFQTQFGALIGIDVAQHWRPGAERFFDKLKKSQILGVLGEIDPSMPGRFATAKKGELSSAAMKLCSGNAIVDLAVKERAITWIPEQMAFSANEQDAAGAVYAEDEIASERIGEETSVDDGSEAGEGDGDHDESALQAAGLPADGVAAELAAAA